MFDHNQSRYASYGIVASIPSELIDQIWAIIDDDLQGVFPLTTVLIFKLSQRGGQVTYDFVQDHDVVASFDTPFAYHSSYPKTILAYDDGSHQTILLPSEANQ